MKLNLKTILKKKFILILTPILCSSLTACNSKETYSSSLSDLDIEYYSKIDTYQKDSLDEMISIICTNHSLLQVNEILHYNITTDIGISAKKKIYDSLCNSFYNSVKKGYDNHLLYRDDNFDKLDGNMMSYLETIFYLESRYLTAYENNDSYEVVRCAIDLTNKIKEEPIENIISFKLNQDINMANISFSDNSNLSNLYNLRDQNNDSLCNEYNLTYIKYISEILYSDYEIIDGHMCKINQDSYERLIRVNYDVIEPLPEENLVQEEKTSFYMDPNGIIWDSQDKSLIK